MACPPTIIVGMHRSGTSILARLLSQSGVWLGADREPRHRESRFFMETNESLLSMAGSSWYQPGDFLLSLASHEKCLLYQDAAIQACRSGLAVRYLGVGRWKDGNLFHQTRPWGWKDPRNCLTLPVWLGLFPQARVLHIVRNGIDVARSLLVRERAAGERAESLWLRAARTLDRLVHLKNPRTSQPTGSLEKAFGLWSGYLEATLAATRKLPDNRCLTLHFEQLLGNPPDELHRILGFLDLSVDAADLETLARQLRKDRSRAFLRDERLVNFFERHRNHPMMRRFGYDER